MRLHSSKLLFRSLRRQARAVPIFCASGILSIIFALPSEAAPIITSISSVSTQQLQTISITGSGFGTNAPYTGDADDIVLADLGGGGYFTAGFVGTFPGGLLQGVPNPTPVDDAVTLIVESWSDSSIVLGGFAGCWGCESDWSIYNGDQIEVFVWNAQTGSGPASITTVVGSVRSAPEPGSLALVGLGLSALVACRRQRKNEGRAF